MVINKEREWIVWIKLKKLKCMDKIKKNNRPLSKNRLIQIKWYGSKYKMLQI